MSDLVWMGHAGHFIASRYCGFHLNTYVNGFIVSTVGEYRPPIVFEGRSPRTMRTRRDADPVEPLGAGADSLFETMVFKAVATDSVCCPYEQENGDALDSERYATSEKATDGHWRFIEKYRAKAEVR